MVTQEPFQGPILEPQTSAEGGPQASTRGSLTRQFAPMVGALSIMMGSVPSFTPKRRPKEPKLDKMMHLGT